MSYNINESIAVIPLGGGADDAVNVQAVLAAAAGKPVVLLPGIYTWLSTCYMISNSYLIGGPGVRIITNIPSISASEPAFRPIAITSPSAPTTLNGAVTIGSLSILVTSAAGISVGDIIRITSIPNAPIKAYYEVRSISVNTLTLDRPVRFPFVSGDSVAEVPQVPENINIIGNGMSISGLAPLYFNFEDGSRYCHVENIIFDTEDGIPLDGIACLNYGSMRCSFSKLSFDASINGGSMNAGFGLFGEENIFNQIHAIGITGGTGIKLGNCVECTVTDCQGTGNNHGLAFTSDAGVGFPCRDNIVRGGSFENNLIEGILVETGHDGNIIENVYCSNNYIGIQLDSNTVVKKATIRRSSFSGLFVRGSVISSASDIEITGPSAGATAMITIENSSGGRFTLERALLTMTVASSLAIWHKVASTVIVSDVVGSGTSCFGYFGPSGGTFEYYGHVDFTGCTTAPITIDGSGFAAGILSNSGNITLQINGTSRLVFATTSITIQAGTTLTTTSTGNINLPNNGSARFNIEGSPVGSTVTAANLNTLTNVSNADALHTHSVAGITFNGDFTIVNSLASFTFSQAQDPSTTGAPFVIRAQRGFAGSVGGTMTIGGGYGGTLGSQKAGDTRIDLGDATSSGTASFKLIRDTSLDVLSITRDQFGIVTYSIAGTANFTSSATMQFIASGGTFTYYNASSPSIAAFTTGFDSTGANTNTYQGTATSVLYTQSTRSGTGANAGATWTITAQAGQQQSGGAANNNGGALILQSGAAGTGGAGAAGLQGAITLKAGATTLGAWNTGSNATTFTLNSGQSGLGIHALTTGQYIQLATVNSGGIIYLDTANITMRDISQLTTVAWGLASSGATSFIVANTVTAFSISQNDITTNSAVGATLTIQAQNATGTTSTGGALHLKSGTGTSTNGQLLGNGYPILTGKTIVKSSDQTVSSTTLTNDTALTFAIGVGESWTFEFILAINLDGDGGFKFAITAPAATTASIVLYGYTDGFGSVSTTLGTSTADSVSTANADSYLRIVGSVINGANAGSITLQFAENSGGGGATVKSASLLNANRTA